MYNYLQSISNTSILSILTGLLLLTLNLPLLATGESEVIYAFRSFTRPESEKLLLVGEIRSKIKAPEAPNVNSPYAGYDTRRDQITVKVVNKEGIKVGQKLYVIDKNPFHKEYRNGMIVGEITVSAIFDHPFFGKVLTGAGNLLRVREGMFVARTLETKNLIQAYERKKRGDHFYLQGDQAQAAANYLSALEADNNLPEAHAALGQLYLDQALERGRETPISALVEFKQAWDNRANFRYRRDENKFYQSYMQALFLTYEIGSNEQRVGDPSAARSLIKNLERVIEIGSTARQIKGAEFKSDLHLQRANYYLMRYYQNRDEKKFEATKKEITALTGRLLKETTVPAHSSSLYLISFLFYNDLYRDITSEPMAVQAKLERYQGLFHFSLDFKRWEDFRYQLGGNGVERLVRLQRYLGEKYDLYLNPAEEKRNPEFTERWRQL